MLAIKECLIREGVLNLANTNNTNNTNTSNNSTNSQRSNLNYRRNYAVGGSERQLFGPAKMDQLSYQPKSVASQNLDIENNSASSNLSSASATANSSCQPTQQQPQPQPPLQPQPTQTKRSATRYQGQHPHFHHHTAPAYYTDIHLRIHTPKATDDAALNENYQSVYGTTSKLVGERHFPKTATATVAPPPISTSPTAGNTTAGSPTPLAAGLGSSNRSSSSSAAATARSAFFRGGSVGSERRSLEHYARLSPASARPAKGDLSTSTLDPPPAPTASPPAASAAPAITPAVAGSNCSALNSTEITSPTSASSSSRSRNPHRFANRKRVVRVRSESRPISALYDIICKEKGLDIGATTTNDEDSSAAHSSHEDERATRERTRRTKSGRHSAASKQKQQSASNMNGRLDSPVRAVAGGGAASFTARRSPHATNGSPATARSKQRSKDAALVIHDLSDDDDHDYDDDDDGNGPPLSYRLKSSPKTTNLLDHAELLKASSLPPRLDAREMLSQNHQQHKNQYQTHLPLHADHIKDHQPSPTQPPQPESPLCNRNKPLSTNSNCKSKSSTRARRQAPGSDNCLYSMDRLYIEPVPMHVSSSSSQSAMPLQAASSQAALEISGDANGTALSTPRSERSQRNVHRRWLRDEKRRFTDGAAGMLPQTCAAAVSGGHESDGGVSEQQPNSNGGDCSHELRHANTNARRFITRANRTPSRSRNGADVVGGAAGGASSHASDSSSCSPSPVHGSTPTGIVSVTQPTSDLRQVLTTEAATNGNTELPAIDSSYYSAPTVMTNSAAATATAASNAVTTDPEAATTATTKVSTQHGFAVVSDKKKDEKSPGYSSPTSPQRQLLLQSPKYKKSSQASSSSDNQKSPGGSESDNKTASSPLQRLRTISGNDSSGSRKLVPSVSVSMKQNLSELHYNGAAGKTIPSTSPKLKKQRPLTAECTLKIQGLSKFSAPTPSPSTIDIGGQLELDDGPVSPHRPRSSTMYTEGTCSSLNALCTRGHSQTPDVSPVRKSRTPEITGNPQEHRDKSAKRKSNLNRSQNEEATHDGDDSIAARRRRRRELGMSRQLIPHDDAAVRDIISPQKPANSATFTLSKPTRRNDLAYHMEKARHLIDLTVNASAVDKRRAQTMSPKAETARPKQPTRSSGGGSSGARVSRRSDTLPLGGLERERKLRSNDVNRKVNERTKSDLAEILKIAEMVNAIKEPTADVQSAASASVPTEPPCALAIGDLTKSINRIRLSHERELPSAASKPTPANGASSSNSASPVKHATFVQGEHTYYEPDSRYDLYPEADRTSGNSSGSLRQRMLKARSVEREGGHEAPKLSPILRRKSTDDPTTSLLMPAAPSPPNSAHSHIVSILKKNYHLAGESSSASSNASPVTFSANVVDTPTKQKRAGILKKRSSLDESRYYSRSHSPDERSILIKSARRNSLEETAAASQQHGILKQQSSYDSSKSDGCPSATEPHPHGILKKKDSNSTPSDGGSHAPKHVSISQAVILAAAELGRETGEATNAEREEGFMLGGNESEYEIRPILKLESTSSDDAVRPPKPILKKKSSGDSDEHEIRPILKTSRKSSREEFDLSGLSNEESRYLSEPSVRPILKTESPSKRRSLGDGAEETGSMSPSLLKRRTRSLERQDAPVYDLAAALNAIATSQATPVEFVTAPPTMSVAERIKNMERVLHHQVATTAADSDAVNTSWESPLQSGAVPKILKPSAIRRDLYRDRYKTQPVTSDEKNFFQATSSPIETSTTSAFKPANSLDRLNYVAYANLQAPSQRALSNAGGNNSTTTTANTSNPSYKLTRSCTQPIPAANEAPSPPQLTPITPVGPSRLYANLLDDEQTPSSYQEQSAGSDSGRIFEMSGIEQDSAMPPQDGAETTEPEQPPTPSDGGLIRKNSVRARANMFQQLQERSRAPAAPSREERTSPRRVPRRPSPPASATEENTNVSLHIDEPKTPNNPSLSDEEIEPTSLPVSERLRFFSRLTEAANRSGNGSYTRSPPFGHIERSSSVSSYAFCSPSARSSISSSSASVTPTPMEYIGFSPQQHELSISEIDYRDTPTTESAADHESTQDTVRTSEALLVLSKSASHTFEGSNAATPTAKRIKLKTIGKLLLPKTFLNNDRNNNTDTSEGDIDVGDSFTRPPPTMPKKIGKVKSPFIENCQQLQAKQLINPKCMKYDLKSMPHHALTSLENNEHDSSLPLRKSSSAGNYNNMAAVPQQNGSEDGNTDSGKENCEHTTTTTNCRGEPTSDIVEMRKKFARIVGSSFSTSGAHLTQRPMQATQQRNTYNGGSANSSANHSRLLIDEKYAKYFGIVSKEQKDDKQQPKNKNAPVEKKQQSEQLSEQLSEKLREQQQTPEQQQQPEKGNSAAVLNMAVLKRNYLQRGMQQRGGSEDFDDFQQDYGSTSTPLTAAVNQNVCLRAAEQELEPPPYPPTPAPSLELLTDTPYKIVMNVTPTTTHVPDMAVAGLATPSSNVTPASSNTSIRRTKRRALTTIANSGSSNATPTTGTNDALVGGSTRGSATYARLLRARALTITNGIPMHQQIPEVKKFEDIVVTKEEFQLASNEFERIFRGVV